MLLSEYVAGDSGEGRPRAGDTVKWNDKYSLRRSDRAMQHRENYINVRDDLKSEIDLRSEI
jgi:hypothetical protein